MKAMILAAGLGTRLKPWTLHHPKALVPVAGMPMLQRVIEKLKSQGFGHIIINVHHFSDQIVDFVNSCDMGVRIEISDETDMLLDTGGGILKASQYFDSEPVLIHNVDILSDANLSGLMKNHIASGNDITLLTSGRDSSRKLMFDENGNLCGWHNLANDEYRPEGFSPDSAYKEEAFSGIYVVGSKAVDAMKRYACDKGVSAFPIMDFLLTLPEGIIIGRVCSSSLNLIDIGKPDTLQRAAELLHVIDGDVNMNGSCCR